MAANFDSLETPLSESVLASSVVLADLEMWGIFWKFVAI